MPAYVPLDRAAERLNVSSDRLWEFQDFGWISIVEKHGLPFIPQDHEYKAKFILRLQQVLKLTPWEVSEVLADEPPFSPDDVNRFLTESKVPKREANVRCLPEGAD